MTNIPRARKVSLWALLPALATFACAAPREYNLDIVALTEGTYDNVVVTCDGGGARTGTIDPTRSFGVVGFTAKFPASLDVRWKGREGMLLGGTKQVPDGFRRQVEANRNRIYVLLDGNDWRFGYDAQDGQWGFMEIIGEASESREKRRRNYDLLVAAKMGDIPKAKDLIAKGADVNKRLMGAYMAPLGAGMASPEMTRLLLDAGAVPGIEVMWASRDGNLETLKVLVAHGGDVDFFEEGSGNHSPLIAAVDRGRLDIVKFLVEKGAKVNKPIYNNITPLYAAALARKVDIAAYLLSRGANPQTTISGMDFGPLQIAEQNRDEAMVALLRKALGKK